MPESTAEKIIDILLVHPDGAEIREIAYEITKPVFSAAIFVFYFRIIIPQKGYLINF
jgi:hypothetical protein